MSVADTPIKWLSHGLPSTSINVLTESSNYTFMAWQMIQ